MFILYKISFLLFLCSFFLCYALTPLARKLALKFNVVDIPSERKIHQSLIPRLGGIALFLSFCVTLTLLYLMISFHFLTISKPFLFSFNEVKLFWIKTALYLIGAALIIFIGILDDIKNIDFRLKLLGQALAASIVILGGSELSLTPWGFLNTLLSFLWIIGLTNSFNLLDNMNGLSGGVASITIFFLIAISYFFKFYLLTIFLIIPLGCLIGFLPYNFPKAKIFLGDTGSLFIGYSLAIYSTWLFTYLSQHYLSSFQVFSGIVFLLSIPLIDTLTVVIIRLKNKKPIYIGDMNHLSHQLVRRGLSTTKAVLVLFISSFLIGSLGLFYVLQ